jgi:hypothetical protein
MKNNNSYTPEQMVAAIRTANYSRGPLTAEQIQFVTEEESARHTAALIDLRSQLDIERSPERRADLERDIAHNESELKFWRSKVATSPSTSVSPPPATPPPPPPADPPKSLSDQFMELRAGENAGTAAPGSSFAFWRANSKAIDQERKAARITASGGVRIGTSCVIYKSAPIPRAQPSKADTSSPLTDQFAALRKGEDEGTAAPGSSFAFWRANSEAIKRERLVARYGGKPVTQARKGTALIYTP